MWRPGAKGPPKEDPAHAGLAVPSADTCPRHSPRQAEHTQDAAFLSCRLKRSAWLGTQPRTGG